MGYTIIDLKPKKEKRDCSLFIFRVEGNFKYDFNKLMAENMNFSKENEE